jgi:thymidylate synthase (FAD)
VVTIFKTIEDCGVELVAYSSKVTNYTHGHSLTAMDNFPAQAARVSFANDRTEQSQEKDTKLIGYLADHGHLTPFEYQHATVMIECPLFIRSQIHRHRTFSFNEISRRYTSEEIGFWTPTTWRKQSTDNKQGSEGVFALDEVVGMRDAYQRNCELIAGNYEAMLAIGVAREQARAILPQSLLTRFYMGGNLRNWVHFLELRLDGHAQYEVRVIAQRVKDILEQLWPNSLKALMKCEKSE